MHDADVVIIGGSIGGSSSALSLLKAGVHPLIVEKSRFPRQKVCGEGLSRLAVNGLTFLDLNEVLEVAGLYPLSGYRIHHADRAPIDLPIDFGFGVSRYELDALLLEEVRQRGGSVIEGLAATDIQTSASGVNITLINGQQLSASACIVADGGRDKTSRFSYRINRSKRYGAHSLLFTEPHNMHFVSAFPMPDYEVFLTPTGPSRISFSAMGDLKAIRGLVQDERLAVLAAELLKQNEVTLTDTSTLRVTCLHKTKGRAFWEGGIIFVGDACEQFDPIGGMGMTHAVLSGTIAAKQISKSLASGRAPAADASLGPDYEQRRERIARRLRAFTRLSYFSLANRVGLSASRLVYRTKLPESIASAVHQGGDKSFAGSSMLLDLLGR